MNRARVRLLLIIFGNPGGDGKTTIAQAIDALAKQFGLSVQLVCADAGNGALRQSIPGTPSVTWGAPPQIGQEIVAAYEKFDVLVIDCGANSSSAAYNIIDLLIEARITAQKQGRECMAILPIGTNKPGAAGMAITSKEAFDRAGFQTHLVRNNRDGSSEYVGLHEPNLPEVPHLASGFMALLNQRTGGWHKTLSDPMAGYAYAMNFIADWLQKVSDLPPIRKALGIEAGGIDFGRDPPLQLRRVVSRLAATSDAALLANQEYKHALADLCTCDITSPTLAQKVLRFREAFRK